MLTLCFLLFRCAFPGTPKFDQVKGEVKFKSRNYILELNVDGDSTCISLVIALVIALVRALVIVI